MDVNNLFIIFHLQICFIINAGDKCMNGDTNLVTKQEAIKRCSEKDGRLVDYSAIGGTLEKNIITQLADGQSTWIEGFATFSPFLVWDGCYIMSQNFQNLKRFDVRQPDLYTCSLECIRIKPNSTHIGVRNSICYCISEAEKNYLNCYRNKASFCTNPCSENIIDYCGSTYHVSIYRLVDTTKLSWIPGEPFLRQCVIAKVENRKFILSTASCLSFKTSGYLFENIGPLRLDTQHCNKTDKTGQVFVRRQSSTRKEAFFDCMIHNGTLRDLSNEPRDVSQMSGASWYWTGLYRAFQLTNITNGNKTSCLAVTKIDNYLFFDPDECIAKKTYLSDANKSLHSSPRMNELDRLPSTDLSVLSSRNLSEFDQESTKIVIILLLVILLTVTSIILAILVCNTRKILNISRHFPVILSFIDERDGTIKENPITLTSLESNLRTSSFDYKPALPSRKTKNDRSQIITCNSDTLFETSLDNATLTERNKRQDNSSDRVGCQERSTASNSRTTRNYNYDHISFSRSTDDVSSLEGTNDASNETKSHDIHNEDKAKLEETDKQSLGSKCSIEENIYYILTKDE